MPVSMVASIPHDIANIAPIFKKGNKPLSDHYGQYHALVFMQIHGTYHMQTHTKTHRKAKYTYHTSAWAQNWILM